MYPLNLEELVEKETSPLEGLPIDATVTTVKTFDVDLASTSVSLASNKNFN